MIEEIQWDKICLTNKKLFYKSIFSAVLSRALVVNDLHLRNGMPRWYVILDSKNYGDEIVKLQPLSHVWSDKKTLFIHTDEKNI